MRMSVLQGVRQFIELVLERTGSSGGNGRMVVFICGAGLCMAR